MVNIIGAGPGGLSAAINLLKNSDLKVSLFEKEEFVGSNVGENFQAVRNYGGENFFETIEKFGIKLKYAKNIFKIVKVTPSGQSMEMVSKNEPLFYIFKRGPDKESIENQLLNNFIDLGGQISFKTNKSLSVGDIIATGAIYRNIWGYGFVYDGVSVDEDVIYLFMDNNYAPQGYIFAIPYGKDKLTIAAVTFDLSCNLPKLFEKFVQSNKTILGFINNYSRKTPFSGFACSNLPKTAELHNKKFVGAAAGFVDGGRGFGIKYSLISGACAAQSIYLNSSYDDLWKKEFYDDLNNNFLRGFFLRKFKNEDYERLFVKEKFSVDEYSRSAEFLKNLVGNVAIKPEVKFWQEKYSIKKIIK